MQFSGAFSQFVEVLLPSSCHQFGSDKLIKIRTGLDIFYSNKGFISFMFYFLTQELFVLCYLSFGASIFLFFRVIYSITKISQNTMPHKTFQSGWVALLQEVTRSCLSYLLTYLLTYLLIERQKGEEWEKEKERNIDVQEKH